MAINLYPQTVYAQFPGTDRDQRYLEDILFLMLCHEFEHMPTGEGGRGVPGHPSDSNGQQSQVNRCETIRHYMRDADRACAEVSAARADPTLTQEERCKKVKGFCRFHKYVQDLANTPDNLQAAPNCAPPIPASGSHVVHDCACSTEECPNPLHHF